MMWEALLDFIADVFIYMIFERPEIIRGARKARATRETRATRLTKEEREAEEARMAMLKTISEVFEGKKHGKGTGPRQ